MTTEATPREVGSHAGLGPAAEAKRLVAHYQQHQQWFGGDEVDEVCRLIDAAVAAERERWQKACGAIAGDLRNHDMVRLGAAKCLDAGNMAQRSR